MTTQRRQLFMPAGTHKLEMIVAQQFSYVNGNDTGYEAVHGIKTFVFDFAANGHYLITAAGAPERKHDFLVTVWDETKNPHVAIVQVAIPSS